MYTVKGREVLWDMFLADKCDNITLEMHKPVRKNIALNCNAPWEGESTCYFTLIHDGEKYRLYYRGLGTNGGPLKPENGYHVTWCVAYSDDGVTFTKPNLGIYDFQGSKDNNIVLMDNTRFLDNFAVMYDTNPDCPADEKFKGLAQYDNPEVKPDENGIKFSALLAYYKSADGLHFEYVRNIPVDGAFDSMNYAFWDESIGKYRLYYRAFHHLDEENKIEYEAEKHVRGIKLALSDDFVTWEEKGGLVYSDPIEIQMYTNNVQRYYRSDIYFGIPTRYIDRAPDNKNYAYLPDLCGIRPDLIKYEGREGTACTEAMIMTSRDGLNFDRTREAFLTPGIECGDNWVYGDCYFARGVAETPSDFKGEPNEMSLYTVTGMKTRGVTLVRYTERIDGFFSWSADFNGGEVLTKLFTFNGGKMSVNFATSALGYLQIVFCDENGKALEGYDSGRIFGDSIDRPVDFEKSLSDLNGKAVRMKISMKDAGFYSFNFEN